MVLAGGGTGGHVYPALAISEIAQRHLGPMELLFIGVEDRAEAHIVPQHGIPIRYIKSRGLSLHPVGATLFTATLAQGFGQALSILREFDPHLLVSTGGYSSAPAVLAAATLRARKGRPRIVIHEQNALPGRANRMASRLADRVMTTFESSSKFFPTTRVVHTGYPVRSAITRVDPEQARARHGIGPGARVILAFGGSGGARSINRAVAGALPRLLGEAGVHVIHGTGRYFSDDYDPRADTASIVDSHGLHESVLARYHPLEYIDDMGSAYAAADLVICRAGAGTLAEIQQAARPALLIPKIGLPHEHQLANARDFQEGGAARVVLERDHPQHPAIMYVPAKELAQAAIEMLEDPDRLAVMTRSLKARPRPDTEKIIARTLTSLIGADP